MSPACATEKNPAGRCRWEAGATAGASARCDDEGRCASSTRAARVGSNLICFNGSFLTSFRSCSSNRRGLGCSIGCSCRMICIRQIYMYTTMYVSYYNSQHMTCACAKVKLYREQKCGDPLRCVRSSVSLLQYSRSVRLSAVALRLMSDERLALASTPICSSISTVSSACHGAPIRLQPTH